MSESPDCLSICPSQLDFLLSEGMLGVQEAGLVRPGAECPVKWEEKLGLGGGLFLKNSLIHC